MIACSNPRAQYLAHKAAIDAAIQNVLNGGRYILGENVQAFESEFAAYIGAKYGVGVGSGTEALSIALRACHVGPGDEVIVPSHTAVATVAAVELAGATPVFADIDPQYYTLDPVKVKSMLRPSVKAILLVHLYGQPGDLLAIKEVAAVNQLALIEDCAQAHGARYGDQRVGSIGDLSCFSFYPTKNLGALGDAGMIVTSDSALAEQCRLLRQYGWSDRTNSRISGLNSRLDELQAAVLRVKLAHLEADNDRRTVIAGAYDKGLAGLPLRLPPRRPDTSHAFHLYVVRTRARDALRAYLETHGVGTLVHYPIPIHLQDAYRGRIRGGSDLVETERAAQEVLSLPMYPELRESDIATVVDAIRSFIKS